MIKVFDGEYAFLSNFYERKVKYDGITYGSSEAAFQAQKTLDIKERLQFASLTPMQSKRKGRKVALRPDWEEVKVLTMYEIVLAKFTQNPDLAEKLIATGDEELVEGNYWHDTFWGVCDGIGTNFLGKILMKIRTELR
jgi:ribA/ribD-fused uncharacterized protein